MCENLQYVLVLKTEYDEKFKRFGVRSKMIFLGYVKDYLSGAKKMPKFDYKKYNLLTKECGQCNTCKLKRSARKAAQSYCESKLHKQNCFLTLTFDHNKLVEYYDKFFKGNRYKRDKAVAYCEWTLEKEHFTNFMKRLRFKLEQEDLLKYCIENNLEQYLYKFVRGKRVLRKRIILPKDIYIKVPFRRIKVLHAAEYGSNKQRPHHHCVIFGYNFDDVREESYYKRGRIEFRNVSDTLTDLWSFGDCTCDECNYQTINYVSRYVTKKVYGPHSQEWYKGRCPEYCTQSNRSGGLGKDYFIQNIDDLINIKSIPIMSRKGKIIKVGLPRYFKELWKRLRPDSYNKYYEESVKQSIEKLEQLSKVGLDTIMDAQSKKSSEVLKKLQRKIEVVRDDERIIQDFRKARAYGVTDDMYADYTDSYDYYLSHRTYRDFQKTYKNKSNYQNMLFFESWRKRQITKTKYRLDIDDCRRFNLIDFYLKLDNPFKIKGYSSKISPSFNVECLGIIKQNNSNVALIA